MLFYKTHSMQHIGNFQLVLVKREFAFYSPMLDTSHVINIEMNESYKREVNSFYGLVLYKLIDFLYLNRPKPPHSQLNNTVVLARNQQHLFTGFYPVIGCLS